MKSRNAYIVRIGRIYQIISPIISWIDLIFSCKSINTESRYPVIFLIAPPRSGSTLTLQLLTSSFENIHLTNLWNLLYATPYIGGKIANKRIKRKGVSNFISKHGFVNGLDGEAEGLRFWSYWTGQSLSESNNDFYLRRTKKIHHVMNLLMEQINAPFISGYLGHSLCIDKLKTEFKGAIFIYLTRNILDNALSLYDASSSKGFSIKTNEMAFAENRYEEIVIQLKSIQTKMISSYGPDTFLYSYEKLCSSPIDFIKSFRSFAKSRGIDLKLKDIYKIPEKFSIKENDISTDVAQMIIKYIKKHNLDKNDINNYTFI